MGFLLFFEGSEPEELWNYFLVIFSEKVPVFIGINLLLCSMEYSEVRVLL